LRSSHKNDKTASCCRIAVHETTVVPPETEMIIHGKPLDPLNKDSLGIIEPNLKFADKTGLLVAKSLVDPKMALSL